MVAQASEAQFYIKGGLCMFWKKVGVIGAGTMGQAISEMLAKNGLDVYIVDKNQDNVDAGHRMIELSLDKQIEKWAITESEKKTILSRIQKAGELFELKECDLIIEAIVEDLESKKNILEQLGRLCHSEVVIASNTSTLSITEIARAVWC
jgi:3-hydroxybutyryl-CoA dehydrogenase